MMAKLSVLETDIGRQYDAAPFKGKREALPATLRQTRRTELLHSLAGAREVRDEGVVVEEEFAHLRKEFPHIGHFVGDILPLALWDGSQECY